MNILLWGKTIGVIWQSVWEIVDFVPRLTSFQININNLFYFQVPKTLTFKTRLSANSSLWNWVLFVWAMKIHFHINGLLLSLALKQSLGQLGNSPLFGNTVQFRDKRTTHTRKTHVPFLDIRVGMHAWTLMHVFLSYSLPLFFFVFHCLAKRIYSFLNEHLFLYQNIHVPWSFRRIKIYSPTAKTNNK